MDALINDGINSNSVLENTRNAQKQYDIYSALDASIVSPDMALSVAVDVEIGEKSEDGRNTILAGSQVVSNTISISNTAQAKVAPDLGGLRSGQDLNSRLQLVSSGLDEIKSSLDQLASQIKPDEDYSRNTVVQEALGQIKDIIENSNYAGSQVFTSLSGERSSAGFGVTEASELTEKKHSTIQSTILANRESVAQNQDGIPVTKSSETFVLANSNDKIVFSFSEKTSLDVINQTVVNITKDSATNLLVYFDDNYSADIGDKVEGAGEPVQFNTPLKILSLDGQLFSTPLDTYTPEKLEEVEPDYALYGMSDRMNERRRRVENESSEDNMFDGGKTDYISFDDDLVTRYKKANSSFGADRRSGDGFGVTPIDPGESSGSLTGGSELRDKAKSTNYSKNFDASGPSNSSDDVMLLPDEESVLPYVTLEQRESGVTGYESLDQLAKKVQGADQGSTSDFELERYRTMFETENMSLGGETFDQLQRITKREEDLISENSQESKYDMFAVDQNKASDNSSMSFESYPNNSPEVESLTVDRLGGEERITGNHDNIKATYTPNVIEKGLNLGESSAGSSDNSYTGNSVKSDEQNEASITDGESIDSQINSFSGKGRYIGTNPVKELEGIRGVISETLMFTLRGNIGAMDYVVAAGVSVDTLSLAINTTTSFTGVTANNANGRISLAGTLSLREAASVAGIEDDGFSNSNNSNSESDFGQGSNENAAASSSAPQDIAGNTAADNSSVNAVGLTTLQSGIDLVDLGFAKGRAGNYNLDTFSEAETPEELVANPQLARRIISNAYRNLDTIQNNIDSISSLNQRSTYDALERVGSKILDGGVNEILSSEESEKVLNNISVGINNSVSANGGRGLGDTPIASLNLLSNIENVTLGNYTQKSDSVEKNYLTERLTRYQSMVDYEIGYEDSEVNFEQEQNIESDQDKNLESAMGQSVLSIFEENLTDARARLQELRDIYETGGQSREDYRELIQRAEDRYFTNIEDAKATIRELGRGREIEDYDKETIEKGQSAKLFDEYQSQLENAGINTLSIGEGVRINQSVHPSQSAVTQKNVHNVSPHLSESQNLENILAGYNDFINRNTEELIVPSVGMDSLTTRPSVAVTSSAHGDTEQSNLFENEKYESAIKLFEDKIGTVMVHGQGYTIKDLEGSLVDLLEREPEIVESVLDKALEDIDNIRNDIADLQTQELEYAGDALLAAVTTYGSDQSADNPEVIKRTVAKQ